MKHIVVLWTTILTLLRGSLGTPPLPIKSSSVILTEGSNATVPCRVNIGNALMVAWFKGKSIVHSELVIRINEDGDKLGPGYGEGHFDIDNAHSLLITSVNKSDEGRYFCEIVDRKTKTFQNNNTDVTVIDKPHLYIEGCNNRGDCTKTISADTLFVLLRCSLIGAKGNIYLYWTRDGSEDDIIGSTSTHSDVPSNYSVTMRQDVNDIRIRAVFACVAKATSEYTSLRAEVAIDIQPSDDRFASSAVNDFPQSESIWSTSQGTLIVVGLVVTVTVLFSLLIMISVIFRNMRELKRNYESGFSGSQDSVSNNAERRPLLQQSSLRRERSRPPTNIRRRHIGAKTHSLVSQTHDVSQLEERFTVKRKVYNDPIHGSIKIPAFCQLIIDTPEFQRLRYIKQIGCTCYVFPSAVHTTFEHSIGVSHFAGMLLDVLREDKSNDITEKEAVCVQIAGLCRNLGRCPFSRAFEDIISTKDLKDWTQAQQSIFMLEQLIERNELKTKLEHFSIYDDELRFIRELILGGSLREDGKLERSEKYFLYQIVNNKLNGVDMDKWDSLVRDAFYLGIPSAFNFKRLIKSVKVLLVKRNSGCDDRKEICFRDKVADNLVQMYMTGVSLRTNAYEHRVCKVVREMLKDAFLAADGHVVRRVGDSGTDYPLLSWVWNVKTSCQLTDAIVQEISTSESPDEGMVKARTLIDRIHNRKLYQCITEIEHAEEMMNTLDVEAIKECLEKQAAEPSDLANTSMWLPENIFVEVSHVDFGRGDENPLQNIPFYEKSREYGDVDTPFIYEELMANGSTQPKPTTTVRIYTKLWPLLHPVTDTDRKLVLRKLTAGGLYKGH